MTHALAENGAAKVYIIGQRGDKLKLVAAPYPEYARSIVGRLGLQ